MIIIHIIFALAAYEYLVKPAIGAHIKRVKEANNNPEPVVYGKGYWSKSIHKEDLV